MPKLIRNMSDEKSVAFWRSVEESAATLQNAPAWMKAGIVLDPQNFETFGPVDDDEHPSSKPPRK
jgi:hypothetical protein